MQEHAAQSNCRLRDSQGQVGDKREMSVEIAGTHTILGDSEEPVGDKWVQVENHVPKASRAYTKNIQASGSQVGDRSQVHNQAALKDKGETGVESRGLSPEHPQLTGKMQTRRPRSYSILGGFDGRAEDPCRIMLPRAPTLLK